MKLMTPDDPRHGTSAGFQKHYQSHTPMCDPCRLAGRRARKHGDLRRSRGVRSLVPLGGTAYRIVTSYQSATIRTVAGISHSKLTKYRREGPQKMVRRSTRENILNGDYSKHATPIGLQRRLRALAVMGWATRLIAEATGMHRDTLSDMRNSPNYASMVYMRRVVDFYDSHYLIQAPASMSTKCTINFAERQGWEGPFAWDDIDLDTEPQGVRGKRRPKDGIVDPAVVERCLGGDFTVHATRLERLAVLARWPGPLNELDRLAGWNLRRDQREQAVADADQDERPEAA